MNKSLKEMVENLETSVSRLDLISKRKTAGFIKTMDQLFDEGPLDPKTKELISIAVTTAIRCEPCIAVHVLRGLEMGCTKEEILDAASVAVIFTGSAGLAYMNNVVLDAIDEFSKTTT